MCGFYDFCEKYYNPPPPKKKQKERKNRILYGYVMNILG